MKINLYIGIAIAKELHLEKNTNILHDKIFDIEPATVVSVSVAII